MTFTVLEAFRSTAACMIGLRDIRPDGTVLFEWQQVNTMRLAGPDYPPGAFPEGPWERQARVPPDGEWETIGGCREDGSTWRSWTGVELGA